METPRPVVISRQLLRPDSQSELQRKATNGWKMKMSFSATCLQKHPLILKLLKNSDSQQITLRLGKRQWTDFKNRQYQLRTIESWELNRNRMKLYL